MKANNGPNEAITVIAIVVVLLVLLWSTVRGFTDCAVDTQPRVAVAPLRWLRTRVTIERDDALRGAALYLIGPSGLETSSFLNTDVRTQWITWTNLATAAGDYEVVLKTSLGCVARQSITVVD